MAVRLYGVLRLAGGVLRGSTCAAWSHATVGDGQQLARDRLCLGSKRDARDERCIVLFPKKREVQDFKAC